MSAGRAYSVTSTPPVTVAGLGPPRTLTGREATIVLALLDALVAIGQHPLGEVRVAFSPHRVEPEVVLRIRRR